MKSTKVCLILGILSAGHAYADEARLTRVLLSQGGVAYYEFAAAADAQGKLYLDAPRAQLDDILKSLVVLGSKARVASVRLPGDAPLSVAFGSLSLNEAAFQSLPDLLRALKGEMVTVSGGRQATGRIVAVDPIIGGDASAALTLQGETGLIRLPLTEVQGMQLADAALNAAVAKALDAFQDARGEGMRRLDITLDGARGQTALAYVAAAPLWKSTYRLTLEGGSGALQGWAVLENYSGHDWKGVEVTLSSGNPAAFHQALYQAYFVDRPEVPVEMFERILPPQDEGAMKIARAAPPLYVPPMDTPTADLVPAPSLARKSPSIQEEPTQILFKLGSNISLANGQTLTLPIVAGNVPAKLVTYLAMFDDRPLAAVQVENRGQTALPPGVATIYDASKGAVGYLGDARLGMVPAGEDRLLAFAGDAKVKVDRRDDASRSVTSAKIADGVLTIIETQYYTKAVDVALPKGEARTFVVDLPASDNWKLVAPEKGARKIKDGYRITKSFSAGAKGVVEARFAQDMSRRFALLETDASQLAVYVQGGDLSPAMQAALAEVVKRKEATVAAKRRVAEVTEQLQAAEQDEDRARQNLTAVGADALRQRYLDKLVEAEAAVDKLKLEQQSANDALRAAEANLRDYIKNLKVGG